MYFRISAQHVVAQLKHAVLAPSSSLRRTDRSHALTFPLLDQPGNETVRLICLV